MGGVCKRNKEGKGNRSLSIKRKNRRLAQIELRKVKNIELIKSDKVLDITPNQKIIHVAKSHELDVSCKETHMEIEAANVNHFSKFASEENSQEIINENVDNNNIKCNSNGADAVQPCGRRIFDAEHFFSQLFSKTRHEPFDCTILDMYIINEHRKGFYSTFTKYLSRSRN